MEINQINPAEGGSKGGSKKPKKEEEVKYEKNENECEINIFNKTDSLHYLSCSDNINNRYSKNYTMNRNVVIEEEKNDPFVVNNVKKNNENNLVQIQNPFEEEKQNQNQKVGREGNYTLSNFLSANKNEIILLFFINPDCGSEEGRKILNMGVSIIQNLSY